MALVTGRRAATGARSRCASRARARPSSAPTCARPDPRGRARDADARGIERDGGRAAFVGATSRTETRRAAVRRPSSAFGRLDVAVANAGVNLGVYDLVDEPFERLRADDRESTSTASGGRAGRPRGRCVEQGEGGADRRDRLDRLARRLALGRRLQRVEGRRRSSSSARSRPQLAPHGITVNAICPGWVRTAMTTETQQTRSCSRARARGPSARPARASPRTSPAPPSSSPPTTRPGSPGSRSPWTAATPASDANRAGSSFRSRPGPSSRSTSASRRSSRRSPAGSATTRCGSRTASSSR